ncbi:MAG TPA: LysM peptidoglycan-binding domain-containing protein, partial [Pseudobdellovibrionaceae bacterium]|nr:LysM peptidoglycan-binding domain-containing protein [Pseudobdellovibrionaceae bacterium]
MKTPICSSLIVALMLSGTVFAQSMESEELNLGDTSVGEQSDLGTPDPLNALETPEPEIQPMPEFTEVPDENASAPETPAGEAPAPEPSAPFVPDTPEERQADGPDFRREKNFHAIYEKYNVDPTPLDQWEQAAGNRQSQIYKVQRGDTLWDLSSTLFGQPDYWPKIWALNKDEVTNPHQIETWMQIRFFPGDLQNAPTLAVSETPPVPLADGGTVTPAPESASDAALIPPARPRPLLVRKLPDSLPLYRPKSVAVPPTNFEGLRPPPPVARPNAPLSYYVADEFPAEQGEIREAEAGGPTATEYQYVYVEQPGNRIFTVIRDVGSVSGKGLFTSGRVVEVQGEIEVVDQVPDSDLYRAIVRKSLAPVEVGSHLIPGRIETVNTADGAPVNGPGLRIIGAQFTNRRSMTDIEGLVFLDGGRADGVQVGQIYAIYADRKLRQANSLVENSGLLIGHLRV